MLEQPVDVLPATLPDPAPAEVSPSAAAEPAVPLVERDLLVEDVSIDGMCGVY